MNYYGRFRAFIFVFINGILCILLHANMVSVVFESRLWYSRWLALFLFQILCHRWTTNKGAIGAECTSTIQKRNLRFANKTPSYCLRFHRQRNAFQHSFRIRSPTWLIAIWCISFVHRNIHASLIPFALAAALSYRGMQPQNRNAPFLNYFA